MHVLPEVYSSKDVHTHFSEEQVHEHEHEHDKEGNAKCVDTLILIAGAVTPLVLAMAFPHED